MNPHISEEIKNRWKQYEFIGKPFIHTKNGKKYMRARHKVWWEGHNHFYSFDDDFFWHDISVQDLP